MFIGTLLKSLEIEDLFRCEGMNLPRYLAKSFIENTDVTTSNAPPTPSVGSRYFSDSDLNQVEDDDKFFEASENLVDYPDTPAQISGSTSKYFSAQRSFPSDKQFITPPGFSRIAGLLPDAKFQAGRNDFGIADTLDSFVKAQIVICDPDSPLYSNTDKIVSNQFLFTIHPFIMP